MDDFIIDRVFQPLADRLAVWRDCLWVAELLLIVSVGFAVLVYLHDGVTWIDVLLFAWVAFATNYVITRLIPKAARAVEKGHVNPLRAEWSGTRTFCAVLGMTLIGLYTVFFFTIGIGTQEISSALVILTSNAAGYFMACQPNPPPSTQTDIAWQGAS